MSKRIRVLAAKPGLDGHDRGIKVVCAGLKDAGMEVIYTGLRQTPAAIVATALQEDVDVIALSTLSGAHNQHLPLVAQLLREKDAQHILLVAGGIVPPQDRATLKQQGVKEVFGPGTTMTQIAEFIRANVSLS
ncbi:MAG: cobalamin B12-binding domain-containing protein [Proteobacteria bacterium]|nr:cobalamin B12-binding domain-containing protein [Pseudomonadota bacterium]MBU1449555.1 cobalamin B12-binding domain-containing protein [Pseudomonadota bacterium]MBU2467416.1 cobalamin B12-binding domain-containing protein [Pseudomonadota bacterium]MBU2518124.1 cobalamin B12-binding domain-containing protein [Pseudomonadota bacterium]